MTDVIIETLSAFRDARGCLFEPLDAPGLARQKNVHVVQSLPGEVRGNHSHQLSTETTTVVGPCQVRFKVAGLIRDVLVPTDEVWRFTIPPGVTHAYRNTGERIMTMVSFSTQPHDAGGADTLRDSIL
jgi:dTDP-4-dehydrorhamnose 3,5-epimerase-like enzyme